MARERGAVGPWGAGAVGRWGRGALGPRSGQDVFCGDEIGAWHMPHGAQHPPTPTG
jgi:hypothetical protein